MPKIQLLSPTKYNVLCPQWLLIYTSSTFLSWHAAVTWGLLLSLPNKKSLGDLLFLLHFLLFLLLLLFSFSFLSADHELVHGRSQELLTEFRETWWSYRYMFLVGPKVFSFVVKRVKVIFWGVQRGWGLL